MIRFLPVGLLLLAGCSSGGKVSDFTPPTANARKALESALAHWQAGNPPGTVPNTSPAVEVTDTKWRGGQKLKAFEILSEQPPDAAGPVMFTVRLTPPSGPAVEVKYAVLGIDPLLVYRDEDYQKMSAVGR